MLKFSAEVKTLAAGASVLVLHDLATGVERVRQAINTAGIAQSATLGEAGRACNDLGARPSASGSVNSAVIAAALASGGEFTLLEPGDYQLEYWPAGALASSVLVLGEGVTLTDGAASVSGAMRLKAGLWPNGKVTAGDGSCASGVAAISSALIGFSAADVGKRILITDPATEVAFGSRILSVAGDTATLASAPAVTISGGTVIVGSDNSAALQAQADALASKGGTLRVPEGILAIGPMVQISGGITLKGAGHDYGVVEAPAQRGTVLVGTMPGQNAVVRLGLDSTEFTSGYTSPKLEEISVDGGNVAINAVIATARRTRIGRCQIWRGSGNALSIVGQNSRVHECIIGQTNVGDVIDASNASDLKIVNNEIRQGGTGHQVKIDNCSNVLISGNHMYKGFNGLIGSGHPGANVYATCSTTRDGLMIVGNQFDGTYGHHIEVVTAAAATRYGDIVVGNNYFLQIADFPNDTYSCLKLTAAASSNIRAVAMTGNTGKANGANSYKAIVEFGGAGGITHCSVENNTVLNCNAIFSGFTPDTGRGGNSIAVGAGTAVVRSSNAGATSVADGGTVAHGLATTPEWVRCTPSVAGEMVAVTAKGATTFTVAIKKHDGTAGTTQTVYWDAAL